VVEGVRLKRCSIESSPSPSPSPSPAFFGRGRGPVHGTSTTERRGVEVHGNVAALDGPRSGARILSVVGQLAVMQVVLAGSGLVRNKIVAYRLGPTAFGEISQIAAVVSVITTVVCFGMAVSLSRNAAKHTSLEARQSQLAAANAIVLALALVAVVASVALLASGRLLPLAGLASSAAAMGATLLFIAAIPLEGLKNNYLSLLQGVLDVRGLAVRRSVAVVLATVVAVPIVWSFGFTGAAVQFFLLSAFVALLLGWRCRAIGYAPLQVALDRGTVACLASFGLVSMASSFAQGLSDTAVRASLIEAVGAKANGLLQAPYVLSLTLKGIVLTSIGTISLATIAPRSDRADVSGAVARLLDVVVPLGASALGLLGLFGAPALTWLYSEAFAPGAALFPYLLTADLLLVFVWVIGAPLLSAGDRILWLALELVYAAARWGLALLLMRRLGGVAVVVGYLGAVGLHLLLNLAIFRLRYGLWLHARHPVQLAVGSVLVAGLSWAGAGTRPLPVVLAAAAAWVAYTLHHAQHSQLVPALRARLQTRLSPLFVLAKRFRGESEGFPGLLRFAAQALKLGGASAAPPRPPTENARSTSRRE
jgi:O-antigen/teichoic acid export membrane protein